MEAHIQGTWLHEGKRTSDLRLYQRELIGDLPSYDTMDFSFGVKKDNWAVDLFIKNAFDERGQVGRFFQCQEAVCGNDLSPPVYPVPPEYADGQVYIIPIQPRTIGLRFSMDFE